MVAINCMDLQGQGLPLSLGLSGDMAWHNMVQHTVCWMGKEEKPILV